MTAAHRPLTLAEAIGQALLLVQAGQFKPAHDRARALVKARPDVPELHSLMGVVAAASGEHAAALGHFRKALKLRPGDAEAWFNIAKLHRDSGAWREAVAALEQVMTLAPGNAEAAGELGKMWENLGDLGRAEAGYRAAIALNPAFALVRAQLAAYLMARGALDDADRELAAALAAAPTLPEGLVNRAVLRDIQGDMDGAMALFDAAATANPTNAEVQYQRALALLTRGRLAEGFDAYRWRFKRKRHDTAHGRWPFPYWRGEPLSGKRLLIWTEQGPGDEILIAGMVPDAVAAGARVTLACSPRLVALFRRSFPAVEVVALNDVPSRAQFDWQASLSELAAVLRSSWDRFPRRGAYLTADPAATAALSAQYRAGAGEAQVIGVSWRSANVYAAASKSLALADLAPVLAIPNARFVSLQYGAVAAEIAEVSTRLGVEIVHDHTVDPVRDLDRFAAQVAAMDRVVSVSNTTVHVAGGLGVPTAVLAPASVGRIWYWFLDRADTPWYPALRLYRADRAGGWNAAIAAAAGAA